MDDVIRIYTDTFVKSNPGQAGFGVIIELGERQKEITKGYRQTTKPRIELLSVISALESLKPEAEDYNIELYTTSKQIVKAVRDKWVPKTNLDLWAKFNWYNEKYSPMILPVYAKKRTKNNGKCYKLGQESLKYSLFDDKDYQIQKEKKRLDRVTKIIEKLEKLKFEAKYDDLGYIFKITFTDLDVSGVIFVEYNDYTLFIEVSDVVQTYRNVKERELFNHIKKSIKDE